MKIDNVSLLGVTFAKLDIWQINELLDNYIQNDEKAIIAHHNLHSVYFYHQLAKFRSFFDLADLIHADGMSLIYWGKLLGYDLDKKNRVTYLDWIYPLLAKTNKNKWSIFYLGGKPGIAKKAVEILSDSYPEVNFGTQNGYFDVESSESEKIVNKINSFEPNILMVGMGMPRQEKWILDNFERLEANIILSCGACFDYIAGEQKRPPRILGEIGFEWFYRFLNDPKRLFRRYFIEPLFLLPLFLKDLLKRIQN